MDVRMGRMFFIRCIFIILLFFIIFAGCGKEAGDVKEAKRTGAVSLKLIKYGDALGKDYRQIIRGMS